MTEHLPECPVIALLIKGNTVAAGSCICSRLRACEERVFALHPEWTGTGMCKPECAACRRLTELITEWEYGYEKGIDAAREAVATMTFDPLQRDQGPVATQRQVLAAIDALREKP